MFIVSFSLIKSVISLDTVKDQNRRWLAGLLIVGVNSEVVTLSNVSGPKPEGFFGKDQKLVHPLADDFVLRHC